ncbi:MAG: winged helix-turn-helix domain-containing protein [Acidobacteriota bacterium]
MTISEPLHRTSTGGRAVRARFGPFELELDTLVLRRGGDEVPLQKLRARALRLLIERAGEVVRRQDFIAELWPSTPVNYERNMPPIVRNLRKTLGDSAQRPTYIETVRGVGYRFIAPVSAVDDSSRPRRRHIALATAIVVALALLAVLLQDRSAQRPKLVVRDFESQPPGAGRALAFDVSRDLIERWQGHFQLVVLDEQHSPDRASLADLEIRGKILATEVGREVHAELVRTGDGDLLASNRLVLPHHEESNLAFLLNDALLLPKFPPSTILSQPSGHPPDLLLRALHHFDRGRPAELARASELAQQAALTNPRDARTLGLLALIEHDRWVSTLEPAHAREADRWARRALGVDPHEPRALVTRVGLEFFHRRRPDEARKALATLAEQVPQEPRLWATLATLHLARRDHDRAIAAAERASRLAPLSPLISSHATWMLYGARKPQRALDHSSTSLALNHPTDSDRLVRLLLLGDLERWPAATRELELFLAPRGLDDTSLDGLISATGRRDLRPFWRFQSQRLKRISQSYAVYPEIQAIASAAAGHRAAAVAHLRRGWQRRTAWSPVALQFPLFDSYREDPAFAALQQQIDEALALAEPLPLP